MDPLQTLETRASGVPPGFRFHPTDVELVGYYLRKKVSSQKIDLDVIREVDLYTVEPWELQDKCAIGLERQHEWFFFNYKCRKCPTGRRTNRATITGFWKATGRDKEVYDKRSLIGMRKTLVFYTGRAPNGKKTEWIMHEYRLQSRGNASSQTPEEGWVVCRAFKKGCNEQKNNSIDGRNSETAPAIINAKEDDGYQKGVLGSNAGAMKVANLLMNAGMATASNWSQ